MRLLLILTLIMVLSAGILSARTKMVTLPDREVIYVDLNEEGKVLVQEERIITLQKGTNFIDFSWKNVNIDFGSILLQMLQNPEKVRLINVTYPPNENAVVMQIFSELALDEKMRITYLLSGMQTEYSFVSVAENDGKTMDLKGYCKISNRSGEDLENAQLTLSKYGGTFEKNLRNQEEKKILYEKVSSLPVNVEYLWDSNSQPHDPEKVNYTVGIPRYYVMKNVKESNLGRFLIPKGKARIFQKDKAGETIFVGEDWVKFTPVGEELKLYLGDSRDIKVKRRLLTTRDKITRRNYKQRKVLWDRYDEFQYDIENFKDEEVDLVITDHFSGYYVIEENTHAYEKEDNENIKFRLKLKPKEKLELKFTIVTRNIH